MDAPRADAVSRRQFLAGAAASVPAAWALALDQPTSGPTQTSPPPPLFSISLAEWSLHRTLGAGALEHLDFPRTARQEFGIDAVEYVNALFKDRSSEPAYLSELKARCDANGVRSLLIMCDGEGALGDPDAAARRRAVENHHRWVETARFLGCHSIRVNAQSSGPPDEQRRLAADGLRALVDYAAPFGIGVIVENHGGISSNGAWLASVIRAVDHPGCGTLPDFGNFQVAEGVWYDRYQGVAELMPFAKAVSAKANRFDDQGSERDTDFLRMLRIVVDAGYHGYVGIEYEGTELPEPEGIRATLRLLERVREALAAA
jgi:sugar phosphate isomerase/epimerase